MERGCVQKSMLSYALHLWARSRAKSCGRSNIPENGAGAAAFRVFRAHRTSAIHVFPRSRILFWISRGWPPLRGHGNDGWKHRHATSRVALFSIAFQNAIDISAHAMSFSLLNVCCKTLPYPSGFSFLLQHTRMSSRVRNEKVCCRFPSFLSDKRYNCSPLIQNVEPHAHGHPSVQKKAKHK